jgi:hypothetical protein
MDMAALSNGSETAVENPLRKEWERSRNLEE